MPQDSVTFTVEPPIDPFGGRLDRADGEGRVRSVGSFQPPGRGGGG